MGKAPWLVIVCLLLSITSARADDGLERRIAEQLGGFEYVPTRGALSNGHSESEVIDVLAHLARDRTRPSFVRARAAALLGGYRDARSRTVVEAILRDPHESPLVMRAATRALGRLHE